MKWNFPDWNYSFGQIARLLPSARMETRSNRGNLVRRINCWMSRHGSDSNGMRAAILHFFRRREAKPAYQLWVIRIFRWKNFHNCDEIVMTEAFPRLESEAWCGSVDKREISEFYVNYDDFLFHYDLSPSTVTRAPCRDGIEPWQSHSENHDITLDIPARCGMSGALRTSATCEWCRVWMNGATRMASSSSMSSMLTSHFLLVENEASDFIEGKPPQDVGGNPFCTEFNLAWVSSWVVWWKMIRKLSETFSSPPRISLVCPGVLTG